MSSHPNILWIMADQFRADCLGCLGHPAVQTPNLDRLAAEGVLFENAFCQSPVCMASRGCLFTGRYPATIRVRGMGILPPSETTTPEWLQRQGYGTGAFGKVHLTPQLYTREVLGSDCPTLDLKRFARDAQLGPLPDDPLKTNYGFQELVEVEDSLQGPFQSWLARTRPDLAGLKPEPITGGPGGLFVSPYPSEAHLTAFIANHAEAYIRRQTKPWFAFCSFVAPHHPFEAPADQIARYNESAIPLPDWKGGVDGTLIPPPAREAVDETKPWPDAIRRRLVLHYLAAISLIDDQVGRLVKALEETGQLDNTIIVFNADHGEFLGNHGLLRKPSLHYDEVLRVPLLMRLPGRPSAGRRVRGLVELADVHPTLLGLAGLKINPGVQGRDWSEALLNQQPIGRESILSDMYDDPVRPETCLIVPGGGPYMAAQTLRTETWKLTVYPTAGPEYGQLFDLKNDPDESRNLYGDPAFRDIREQMLWRLLQRIAANTDPLPRVLSQW